jgi:alpha-mannosidase
MKAEDCTIHMIGYAHIDPTWLWRWTEGYEEVRATFRSALDRMNETPAFKFTASSACFYAWVKACDPQMFEEIRARVKEGRWDVAGGWWVEPDCNIPGGEAFVRHGLYSQRFFEKEFGVRAKVGFNPDSFGHAGTLPQICKKMGIDYYVYMRPSPEYEMDYPEGTTFWWRANDGTEILACNLQEGYAAEDEVLDRIRRLSSNPHLNRGQTHILGFYGVGNHGGGPTRHAIAQILEARKPGQGLPKVLFSTLGEYFQGFLKTTKKTAIPAIATDLQHHARGCYSAHSEMKRLNRQCEHALMAAERFATVAWLLDGLIYPQDQFEKAWKDVLYNQFHDVLAGTSLESAYQDTRDQLGGARHRADVIANEAVQRIAKTINTTAEGNTVVVINPLPWPVTQTVMAPPITGRALDEPLHFVDDTEQVVPSQEVLTERIHSTGYVFTAELPALGYRCFHARSGARPVHHERELSGDRTFLENEWWRVEFDPYHGHICRLFDKDHKTEALKRGNVLAAIVDSSDTWSHGYEEFRVEAGRFGNARLELLELGDVRATVRVVSTFEKSTAETLVTLHRQIDTIDCTFRINWQQRYTMLKLAYETNIKPGAAVYDTAYGMQVRNTHGLEEPGQKWFDLTGTICDAPYGLAVLNDSKYGFDVCGGTMRVTMLRSPAYAHHDRARYDASLPYAIMDQGWQTVKIRLVPHAGPWEEARIPKKAWELNEPAFTHVESAHKGKRGLNASMIGTEADNVMLTVLKRSEDGKAFIVRGYETAGRPVRTVLHFPFKEKTFEVSFAPHEIKTLRFDPKKWTMQEVNLLEE